MRAYGEESKGAASTSTDPSTDLCRVTGNDGKGRGKGSGRDGDGSREVLVGRKGGKKGRYQTGR